MWGILLHIFVHYHFYTTAFKPIRALHSILHFFIVQTSSLVTPQKLATCHHTNRPFQTSSCSLEPRIMITQPYTTLWKPYNINQPFDRHALGICSTGKIAYVNQVKRAPHGRFGHIRTDFLGAKGLTSRRATVLLLPSQSRSRAEYKIR